MKKSFENSIDKELDTALNFFKNKPIISIQDLIIWENKYLELYNDFKEKRKIKFEKKGELPTCEELKQDRSVKYYSDFCILYQEIGYFSHWYEYAETTKKEILKYEEIKYDEIELKKWLIKNENLGLEELFIFGWELYDDEIENITPKSLKLTSKSYDYIKFEIDIIDYKSIISFCDIFGELFFERKLYPEALERMNNEL